jgi:hypothetical protein
MIDYRRFVGSLRDAAPPPCVTPEAESLWWARRGDWDKAHLTVQDLDSADAARVHAHLHRWEGDDENAAYWYRRAGEPVCALTIEDEWDVLARTLLRDPV